jgi:hypothetical protein
MSTDHNLLETLADIAYIAGSQNWFSGDSRLDISDFILWAKEFEEVNAKTDWYRKDYILAVTVFAENKLNEVFRN